MLPSGIKAEYAGDIDQEVDLAAAIQFPLRSQHPGYLHDGGIRGHVNVRNHLDSEALAGLAPGETSHATVSPRTPNYPSESVIRRGYWTPIGTLNH